MNSPDIGLIQKNSSRFLINAAAFVIVIAGLKMSGDLVIPILISVFLSVICMPPIQWLKKIKIPTVVALVMVITSIWITIFIIGMITFASVEDFIKTDIDVLQVKIETLMKSQIEELNDNTQETWISGMLKKMDIDLIEFMNDSKNQSQKSIQFLKSGIIGISSILKSTISNGFMIMLTMVFMVMEVSGLPLKLKKMPGFTNDKSQRLECIVKDVRQYMMLKTNMSLITGILIFIWLSIIGVKYAFVWGLLAFLLNYIPTIGSIFAAIPPLVIALLGTDAAEPEVLLSLNKAAYTAVGYLLVNIIIGNIIEPRVMGKGLGLSSLVVFLSMVFWGWVFGPVGMVLSVPLTTIVKITLDSKEETRWMAILLGPNDDEESKQTPSSTVVA